MANIYIVPTNKGKKKLCVDGFFYYLENVSKKQSFNWVCADKTKFKYKSRIITTVIMEQHSIAKTTSEHSHEPSAADQDVFQANKKVKRLARKSCMSSTQIIQRSIIETPSCSRNYLPTIEAQKAKIKRVRKNIPRFKEPERIQDIDIPINLYVLEGELFVLSEKQVGNDLIIILGTKSSLNLLCQSDCWIMDGTFDVVPTIMRQLFSIHGRVESHIIPLVFCLMSKKTLALYKEFFEELKKIALQYSLNLQPNRIICDFEKAIISSVKLCFPEANLRGCFFHFGQILWRKVQKERYYTNNFIFLFEFICKYTNFSISD